MSDSVCLISPNDLTREGLSAILMADEFEVICAVDSIDSLADQALPDEFLAVIDCSNLESRDQAVERIVEAHPSADVVALADKFDLQATLDCFRAGAKGVIVKSFSSKPLMTALRLVALGERVYPSQMIEALESRSFGQGDPFNAEEEIAGANLSPRELDVLCCLMAGYPNKTIARQLDVCEATVKVHVKAILRKLNVHNRTQAAIWASARNLPDSVGMPG